MTLMFMCCFGPQADEPIDDWEVWGDPKEIERRKAERKRAAMHPEARKEQVTHLSQLSYCHQCQCPAIPLLEG